jgi:class 3 adenylate cyclase
MRNPDFDPTEILRIGKRSDEFGELARSFSEMAEVVAIREKQLEGLVEKRTEQVREQAREIELKNNQNEQLLLNILPLPIARRLQKGERDIADSYSSASVLFSDLVGFTTLSSEMSSNALLVMLNEIFTEFDHLCLGFGVEKIKTLGDGYMAAAGLPVPREDHASVLIALALGMQGALLRFNEKHNSSLQLRIGINSGPVTAGVIGTHKFIYDLWGDAVNIASRMESTGEPDRIQISQSTYKWVKDTYLLESRGEIDVKGKGKMKTWWVSGVQEGANLPMLATELQERDFDIGSITQPDTALDSSSSWADILRSDVSMTSIRALLGKDLFGQRGNQQNTEARDVKSAAENITWEELLKSEVNRNTLRMLLKKDLFGRKRRQRSPSEIVSTTEEILDNLAAASTVETPPKDKDIS